MQVGGGVWLDLQTEDRNIYQCKKEEVKSPDLTTEEKKKSNTVLITQTSTHSC